ncbi:MAG: hypothetical protein V4629_05245 [Pseudomonadota bacterium]
MQQWKLIKQLGRNSIKSFVHSSIASNLSHQYQEFAKVLPWLPQKKNAHRPHLGVEISNEGIGFALLSDIPETNAVRLSTCQYIHSVNPAVRAKLLGELVARQNLQGAVCNLVLAPSDYKILLVEAPDVPKEEWPTVVPWRIRDLIPWDVYSCQVDLIMLPPDAFRGRMNMLYVVVAQQSVIQSRIECATQAGLVVKKVDIVELCLRNLLIEKVPANETRAVLFLRNEDGILILMSGDHIYLTRKINVAIEDLMQNKIEQDEFYDLLVLELQRSLDYYESQVGKGNVPQILIFPPPFDIKYGLKYISENMSSTIRLMNVHASFHFDGQMSVRDQNACVPAIGAGLSHRVEGI